MKPFSDTLICIDVMTLCFIIADKVDHLPWNKMKLGQDFLNFSSFQFYILFDVIRG